jgi:hypothetical protein
LIEAAMRIFRAEEHRLRTVSPEPESAPEWRAPVSLARRPSYPRLNWWTARDAIARSRALLERNRNLPGLRQNSGAAIPLPVEAREVSSDRLLALRRSCESVYQANHLVLKRAERILARSTLLICAAENLRRRMPRVGARSDSSCVTSVDCNS